MAKLYFKVGSDWEEVVRLRNEIAKLKQELMSMDGTQSPAAFKALNAQLTASKPALSSGFMIVSIAPLSKVPSGLNLTPPLVSGTCLIHTTIFTALSLLIFYNIISISFQKLPYAELQMFLRKFL